MRLNAPSYLVRVQGQCKVLSELDEQTTYILQASCRTPWLYYETNEFRITVKTLPLKCITSTLYLLKIKRMMISLFNIRLLMIQHT